MKKLFAIVLAVVMALSLAACGQKEPDPTTVPTTTAAPTTVPETTVPETTVPETTAPVEMGSKVGTVEGNTYTNAFLGITATPDTTWIFATEEEMAQIRGMTAEAMTDEKLTEVLETSGAIMDMYAMDTNGRTVNVVLENLNILQSIAITEKGYADATVGQLPTALENMGFTFVSTEVLELTFAGETHAAVKIHAKMADTDFFETLVIVKQGNYIACITAASYMEDTTAEVLEMFTAI